MHDYVATAYAWLAGNQFASAGVMAAAAAIAYRYAASVGRWVGGNVGVMLHLTRSSPGYDQVLAWLHTSGVARQSEIVSFTAAWTERGTNREKSFRLADGVCCVPAVARPVLRWFGWTPVLVYRTRTAVASPSVPMEGNGRDSEITLRFLTFDRGVFERFMQAAYANSVAPPGMTEMYVSSGNTYASWTCSGVTPTRPRESVFLTPDAERVLSDLQAWVDAGARYERLGVPRRRGYLFSGVSGSGKTTMVRLMASTLGAPVYALDLTNNRMTLATLHGLLVDTRHNSVILIEDIDAVTSRRRDRPRGRPGASDDSQDQAETPLSTVLNAIDGMLSGGSYVVVATTNHPELLDPALVRPGRFDVHVTFGWARREQVEGLFRYANPDASPAAVKMYVDAVFARGEDVVMASVMSHLANCTSVEEAIATAPMIRRGGAAPTPTLASTAQNGESL